MMGWAELSTVVAVLLISAWLARNASLGARVALGVSMLLVSAGMLLPLRALRGLIGQAGLTAIYSMFSESPWPVEAVAHFTAFLWLALVLWTMRPDLRGWKSIFVLAALAIGTELMQGLSADRTPRLGDAGVNLLGGCAGLILGVVALQLSMRFRRAIPASERYS